jgi:hypothetical protein
MFMIWYELLKKISLSAAALIAFLVAISLLLPSDVYDRLKYEIFGVIPKPPDFLAQLADVVPPSYDHRSVSDWVSQCIGITSIDEIPSRMAGIFNTPYDDFRITSVVSIKSVEPKRNPNGMERSALQLSRILVGERVDLSKKVRDLYSELQWMQWIIIVIGFFTTALVAVSATEFGKGDGRAAKSIRILAVVFPALGTAVAALNAFYAPREQYGQATHTLASLVQLHHQIAVETLGSLCTDENDARKAFELKLVQWNKRYQDIAAVTLATQSGGGGSGATGGGQNSPNVNAPANVSATRGSGGT